MKKQHHNNMRKPKSVFLVSATETTSESHSYIVGIYSSLSIGMSMCESEEEVRGGKYTCYLAELVLNEWVSPSYVSYRVY
jgi:uncharacterized protein YutE (UPF0331/DUF86 family)